MTKHRTKAQRREEILDAAITCFSKTGYYETSMDDIVREAGLSKGALYWHFPSKRELFRALVETWFEEMETGLAEAMAGSHDGPSLASLVQEIQGGSWARPELIRAMLEFYTMALRDAELKDWLREAYRRNVALFSAILDTGGDPRRARWLAQSTLAFLDGLLLHQELFEGDDESPDFLAVCTAFVTLLELARSERSNA